MRDGRDEPAPNPHETFSLSLSLMEHNGESEVKVENVGLLISLCYSFDYPKIGFLSVLSFKAQFFLTQNWQKKVALLFWRGVHLSYLNDFLLLCIFATKMSIFSKNEKPLWTWINFKPVHSNVFWSAKVHCYNAGRTNIANFVWKTGNHRIKCSRLFPRSVFRSKIKTSMEKGRMSALKLESKFVNPTLICFSVGVFSFPPVFFSCYGDGWQAHLETKKNHSEGNVKYKHVVSEKLISRPSSDENWEKKNLHMFPHLFSHSSWDREKKSIQRKKILMHKKSVFLWSCAYRMLRII